MNPSLPLGAKRVAPIILSAVIGLCLLILIKNSEWRLFYFFLGCAAFLGFFTVLIQTLQKRGVKSAPELMARATTFWWMLALFLLGICTHKIFIFLILLLGTLAALHEFLQFYSIKIPNNLRNTIIFLLQIMSVFAFIAAYRENFSAFATISFLPLILVFPVLFVVKEQLEDAVFLLGLCSLAILFFPFALGHSVFLLQIGPTPFLLCLLLTELRDLLSYWLGKFFVKALDLRPSSNWLQLMNRKIAVNVSPNKTWGTGILSALVIALLTMLLYPLLPAIPTGPIATPILLLWGLSIGFFGLMGDLVFSLLKRAAGIKDSGTLLPGATGLIDRIDSLVFTIPVSMHLLYWLYR